MFKIKNIDEQILGDNLFKKVEILYPGKIKKCQRIVGMFLDYKDREIIKKSLSDEKLFKKLVEGAILCIKQYKDNQK